MTLMNANARFNGKVVIVTGAGQGIGRGVALRAASEGAAVVLVDRADIVHEVSAEIAARGARSLAVVADLETYAGACTMARAAIDSFGRIDILINNVGGTIWAKPYQEYEEAQIEAEVRRSLFPTLWCCRAALPAMIEQQRGAIVNVSSIATRSLYRVPYAASKGGVNALTASLAFEHAENGIRVNAVATGGTEAPPRSVPRNTAKQSEQEAVWYQGIVDQTLASSLMHRYGTIDEQVGAILFLASDEASYVTGTVLPVGGGDQG
ncbi:1,6-dihydroxycyclohexa-2,4-diene-1-carboxylate dehydrogenase [Burkholderia sp. R-69927]|nr:1,6-dihydroxycyclohexa-2,4-diene-1-carboxylate dehydrogenase [Paraburkholderia domus]MBK5063525.1 1,6-dihydroxycyclohexa-2,4-diene-1-carboxylate dehydrogenase [Burkholderia sp. R-70199]MBK5088484.1 1,6-dihydroxycyclohexa-2,4-diene-1-carboxylate dehydrogenase [Burkholderia sp. R-69927]MBK5123702.1 1,6-dihydroxycyclohexa-2,4-diene-1-carboxylate dehydrogenase [Burkholderia sp. R-69980]MBK5169108.1 1,6-dihydroxycyclohexa-2,4-diene-1-carboxylate dehydrogenase [Burkholderia sp. R-70211]MBK5183625